MKKKDFDKFYMAFWGISFGVVCACMSVGLYHPISCVILMVIWAVSAYNLGRSHGVESVLKDIDKMIQEAEREGKLK